MHSDTRSHTNTCEVCIEKNRREVECDLNVSLTREQTAAVLAYRRRVLIRQTNRVQR